MVQQEVATEQGWSRETLLYPSFNIHQGWEPLTMSYGQIASSEQLTFLGDEPTSKLKQASVPIYRVSLVRESRLHCYHKQIRSSADASTLLHTYLADVDREHFVVLMLDQKNK